MNSSRFKPAFFIFPSILQMLMNVSKVSLVAMCLVNVKIIWEVLDVNVHLGSVVAAYIALVRLFLVKFYPKIDLNIGIKKRTVLCLSYSTQSLSDLMSFCKFVFPLIFSNPQIFQFKGPSRSQMLILIVTVNGRKLVAT